MTSASKDLPWSEWSLWGTPYTINHSRMRALATVIAFWFLVGMATVNFMKTSVRTNTFSWLSDAGCSWVKSMARTSSGLVAYRSSCYQVRTLRPPHIARTQRPSISLQHAFLATSTVTAQPALFVLAPGVQSYYELPSALHFAWHLVLPGAVLAAHHCCVQSCTAHHLSLQYCPSSSPVVRLLVSPTFVLLWKAFFLGPGNASVWLLLHPSVVMLQSDSLGWKEGRLPVQCKHLLVLSLPVPPHG